MSVAIGDYRIIVSKKTGKNYGMVRSLQERRSMLRKIAVANPDDQIAAVHPAARFTRLVPADNEYGFRLLDKPQWVLE